MQIRGLSNGPIRVATEVVTVGCSLDEGAKHEEVVEAAGVEPASENVCPNENYVRFRFVGLSRYIGTGK